MLTPDEIRAHNIAAWTRQVETGDVWTRPVDAEVIARAHQGDWSVVLTPNIPVPRAWFGGLSDCDLLALASGGGQQGPILAAAGARVTVFDACPAQLDQDRAVAQRDGLDIRTVQGFMHDLSVFADASFDLIFHPVSNSFAPEVKPVWRECFRVLRPGGALLAGFMNPMVYLFDEEAEARGELIGRWPLPHDSARDLPPAELQRRLDARETLDFSHSLQDQIGGQCEAGFHLTALFEDRDLAAQNTLRARYFPACLATRAVKPRG